MRAKKESIALSKRILVATALCLTLLAGVQVHRVMAQDDGEDESVAPSFSNPAQAEHAANLAAAAASQTDGELASLQSDVEQAERELNEAITSKATELEIQAAEDKLTAAQEAYANELAEVTGVMTAEIDAMRTSGMGWGQIAHELGVHPGLLGLGHTKREKKGVAGPGNSLDQKSAEISEATERNTRSGWSKGHGVGLNAGVDSTTKSQGGYAFGHEKKAAAAGIGGTAGLSGGQSRGMSSGKGTAGSDGSPGNSGGSKGGKDGNGNAGGKGNAGGNGNSGGKGKGGGKGK